jgi:hypothetical protein
MLEREFQLPGLLARGVFETHDRCALLSVRPFTPSETSEVRAHPARLRGPLLRPRLTSRSARLRRRPFRRKARPPQVRVVAFAARSPRLRRPPLVARASRSLARSPWLAAPCTRFLFVDPQRFCSPLLSASASRPAPCGSLRVPATKHPGGLAPPGHAHAGHTSRGGRGDSPRPPVWCCQLTGVHPTHGQRLACGLRRPGRTCVPSIWTAVSAFGLSPTRARIVGATWVVSTEADST